jgi:hypothetical protein
VTELESNMDSNYRVRYKNGDFEIEVESSDKNYVDAKIIELIAKELSGVSTKKNQEKKSTHPKKNSIKKTKINASENTEEPVDITAIVSAINDDDDHEKIEEQILNKSGQLPRIIMSLYFAQEVLNSPITTGDIQTITDQLGIKIGSANAANTIKGNLKFFTADTVRKKGAVIKYKLNRKGIDAYKKILNGEKI